MVWLVCAVFKLRALVVCVCVRFVLVLLCELVGGAECAVCVAIMFNACFASGLL